ncbi:hypothetical protein HYU16_01010 [Candidatus Woesearchaeota archaeon]|nr:hypothetical protein [Candidatus Woesearchaeota archaeon]
MVDSQVSHAMITRGYVDSLVRSLDERKYQIALAEADVLHDAYTGNNESPPLTLRSGFLPHVQLIRAVGRLGIQACIEAARIAADEVDRLTIARQGMAPTMTADVLLAFNIAVATIGKGEPGYAQRLISRAAANMSRGEDSTFLARDMLVRSIEGTLGTTSGHRILNDGLHRLVSNIVSAKPYLLHAVSQDLYDMPKTATRV